MVSTVRVPVRGEEEPGWHTYKSFEKDGGEEGGAGVGVGPEHAGEPQRWPVGSTRTRWFCPTSLLRRCEYKDRDAFYRDTTVHRGARPSITSPDVSLGTRDVLRDVGRIRHEARCTGARNVSHSTLFQALSFDNEIVRGCDDRRSLCVR